MIKRTLLGAGCAMALGFSGLANAALLSIGAPAGTPFSTVANNNVLGAGVAMNDDAGLATTAAGVRLDYYFLGSESGFENTLATSWGTHAELNGSPIGSGLAGLPFSLTALPGASGTQAAAGGVTMSFSSTGSGAPAGSISLGGGSATRSIALAYLSNATCTGFVSVSACVSAVATDFVLFAFDDSGAGPDDNHDDYVGVLVASRDSNIVPIPAAVWLLGSGLLGLFGIRRRVAA